MSLDGAFLHCVMQEMLDRRLVGGRVDKIHQPSRDELIITIRTFGGAEKILFSADSSAARVSLTAASPENPKQPPMLCMLMRKHLQGGRLTGISQDGLERIINLDFECTNEIGDLCDAISDMAKDLQTAEQMKNDFISRVSHELRTPLTAIKGWAETMQLSERGKLDRRTFDKGMNVIIKESGRLTSIVEELLDFGRIQSGRMVLMCEKIDILAEFDETVYMLKERAVEEGIHLLYDDPEAIYPPVYGDRNRLKQVFINVLDNALKYTPKGGVVAAQVIYSKDEPDVIKIIVTDTGCGISAEDLPKVKEKFYKANQTVRGSGIGLAVADEIMNLHHGSLDIESGEGVGTTVTLTFPIYKEGEENTLPENVKL